MSNRSPMDASIAEPCGDSPSLLLNGDCCPENSLSTTSHTDSSLSHHSSQYSSQFEGGRASELLWKRLGPALPRIVEEDEFTPRTDGAPSVVESEPAEGREGSLEATIDCIIANAGTPNSPYSPGSPVEQQSQAAAELLRGLIESVSALSKRMDSLEGLVSTSMREMAHVQCLSEMKLHEMDVTDKDLRGEVGHLGRSLFAAISEERNTRIKEVAELRNTISLQSSTPKPVSPDAIYSLPPPLEDYPVMPLPSAWQEAIAELSSYADKKDFPSVVEPTALKPVIHRVDARGSSCSTDVDNNTRGSATPTPTPTPPHPPPHMHEPHILGELHSDEDLEELQAMSRSLTELHARLQQDLRDAKAAVKIAEQQVMAARDEQEAERAAKFLELLESRVQVASDMMKCTEKSLGGASVESMVLMNESNESRLYNE